MNIHFHQASSGHVGHNMRYSTFGNGLTVLAAIAAAACGNDAPPPARPLLEVGIVLLQAEPVPLTRELPGRVTAFETSEVRPQVSGIVRRRYFTEGMLVTRGQLLYQIDDAPYRADLGTAQGQLARARASIQSTALQAQRYSDLVRINAVSRQDADNARAAAQQARAEVEVQRAAVQTANISLGYTQVRAPISGRIGRSLFTTGTLVQAGQADALATIQRTDPVYVDMTQSAASLLDLRTAIAGGNMMSGVPRGARVSLLLPNGARYPIEGTLQFAEVGVEASTGSVTVRATFPNPHGLLLPGMFVRARLVERTVHNAILVPAKGVSRDEVGRPTVLVVDRQNKVALRTIQTSRLVDDRWLVTSGLSAGEKIIVEGGEKAEPGTTVKVRMVAATAPAGARPAPPPHGS
jgi:membrane fusion protein (multidrug efflux system)